MKIFTTFILLPFTLTSCSMASINETEKYNPKNLGTVLTNATDSLNATASKYTKNELKKGHDKDIQENRKNGLLK